MSQTQRIKELLGDGEFHCVIEMMMMYIPDYRRRICDLKKYHKLEGKSCTLHDHKSKTMKMWRLNDIVYKCTSNEINMISNSPNGLGETENAKDVT